MQSEGKHLSHDLLWLFQHGCRCCTSGCCCSSFPTTTWTSFKHVPHVSEIRDFSFITKRSQRRGPSGMAGSDCFVCCLKSGDQVTRRHEEQMLLLLVGRHKIVIIITDTTRHSGVRLRIMTCVTTFALRSSCII
jgi:hypothetical protein